ncbi:hypothetical protein FUAX_49060 (plasmid) [Fulvitalea axinellae]|uniref:ParB/Sulfiredoxin domain-containing protein n=1 Tax=Fulvitalea axinellae TaxID=1182444 RepID=A0AAU9D1C5_9BACT|nr:hypothetical protein FUAX_49060 [Fulvitalea axinellae]
MAKKKIQVRRRGVERPVRSTAPKAVETATQQAVAESASEHISPTGNAGKMLREIAQGRKEYIGGIGFTTSDDPRISIHPELRHFIPKLTRQEKAKLRESILRDGCRDAILLWRAGEDEWFIVDGHNRYAICHELDLEFPYRLTDFSGLPEAKSFMLDLQLGKRNLVKWQVSYFRGMKYVQSKNQHGGHRTSSEQNVHLGNNADEASEQNVHLKKVSERLAEEFGVSHMTIQRDARFYQGVEALPKDVRERLMNRVVRINKQFVEQVGAKRNDRFADPNEVMDYLKGKLSLDEENATEKDREWIKEYLPDAAPATSPRPEFDAKEFKKKELAKCRKMIKNISSDDKESVLKIYQDIVSIIKKEISENI